MKHFNIYKLSNKFGANTMRYSENKSSSHLKFEYSVFGKEKNIHELSQNGQTGRVNIGTTDVFSHIHRYIIMPRNMPKPLTLVVLFSMLQG